MKKASQKQNFILSLAAWHFYLAPKSLLAVWGNYLGFYWDYFSIPLLLKTLFSPWRRQTDSYGRGFDIKVFLEALVGNLISRFFGGILRLFTIIIGLLVMLFVFVAGLSIVLFWLAWPAIFGIGLAIGIYLII